MLYISRLDKEYMGNSVCKGRSGHPSKPQGVPKTSFEQQFYVRELFMDYGCTNISGHY